jgi:tetratricopeptide (TPR) repeat protein
MFFPRQLPTCTPRSPSHGHRREGGLATVGKIAACALVLIAAGCTKAPPPVAGPAVITDALRAMSTVPAPDAQACAACHAKEVKDWMTSQHANANRLVDPQRDGDAKPAGRDVRGEAVIGITPLIQYLAPFPGGRLQVVDMAFDTRSNEWFYAFNDERMPHEWGYWTNRSMTWNAQCASCHMTGFEKRYDPASDTYASTWQAMGISCAQCHVVSNQGSAAGGPCPMTPEPHPLTTNHYVASCASCHARREELTGAFKPGDVFDDHFRLTLADSTQFHPDGQVNDENFEYGSFQMSRMAHRGVTCLDCHDPHSGKPKQSCENNTLCLQCHIPPGLRGATPIDPVAHSGHAITNSGSQCVGCHMPYNTYVVRDNRRDHGFTSPDPVLTKELGIPNACTACHKDKNLAWEIEWVEKWYGTNMERRARSRARVIAAARRGGADAVPSLLQMAATEEIASWRAALVELLAPWSYRADVRTALQNSLRDTNALVRAAAIHGLQGTPDAYALIEPLRRDPVRLVRIDAARATLNEMERDPVSFAEVKAYLAATCDQPAGALRQAQLHMAEGRMADAEAWARKGMAWDPSSAESHSFLGQFLHHAGKTSEAEAELRKACALATNDAAHTYTLALVLAEQDRPAETLALLERTVALDPDFGRAWYNLGLAQAGLDRRPDAIVSLQRSETLTPDSPDAAYALATVYAQLGRVDEARAAAHRALAIMPSHRDTLQLLRSLPPESAR